MRLNLSSRKRKPPPSPESKPLGDQSYVLVSVNAFKPASHTGHKMEARGLLYRQPGENRLNLTSLRMLSPTCSGLIGRNPGTTSEPRL